MKLKCIYHIVSLDLEVGSDVVLGYIDLHVEVNDKKLLLTFLISFPSSGAHNHSCTAKE